MATRMQQRRGTATQWTTANPILGAGEIGYETDTAQFKIGDGVNTWSALSYFKNLEDLNTDGFLLETDKGVFNGVASLDSTGNIPVNQLGNLIDGAPNLLNTLNEISAAINDDSDFANTVVGNIASALTDANEYTDTSITQEVIDRNNAITLAVGGEETARINAFDDLSDAIATLTDETQTAITDLTTSTSTNLGNHALDTSTHGVSEIVGATEIQILTNKTLTSPTITGASLTDGTITDATINTPAITDGTISNADIDLADITSSNISTSIITGGTLESSTINTPDIIGGSLSDATIDNATVTGSSITGGSVANLTIDNATITGSSITSPTGLVKLDVGLSNVDNTADLDKPVSTATQTALNNLNTDLESYAQTQVSNHNALTENIHGIADTAALATKSYADTAEADAITASEGYVDGLVGDATIDGTTGNTIVSRIAAAEDYTDSQIDAHVAVTTNVHGIADTSKIVLKDSVSTTLDGALVITGDLTVNGTNFSASATSITIEDNMVQLAHQNAANTVDLGLVVGYNDGAVKHSGIVRDVSADKWKLFKGVTTEPSTTVDFTQGSLDDIEVNNITAAGVVFSDGTQTKEGVPSQTPIIQKTASYTLSSLTERDDLIEMSSSSAITLTIPADATLNFPIGTSMDILQTSTGQVTIAGAAGVTVNATPGLKLRTQWSSATLFKRSADTWVVYGDLMA